MSLHCHQGFYISFMQGFDANVIPPQTLELLQSRKFVFRNTCARQRYLVWVSHSPQERNRCGWRSEAT